MKSAKSQSSFALLKGVGCKSATAPQPGCYNIQIKLLVLEHTNCNLCYNTRIKLLEHTSVLVVA